MSASPTAAARWPRRLLVVAAVAGLALGAGRLLARVTAAEPLGTAEWAADAIGPDELAG